MAQYVALLRAVNVGGTGKLPMSDLKEMCAAAGLTRVETYIASGNVVFDGKATPSKLKAELERRLQAYAGKPVGIMLRSAAEMQAILTANPFPKAKPNYAYVVFLDAPPPRDALAHVSGRQDEEIRLGKREIYVNYPGGMGRSKLKIAAAKTGTARNLNTVDKLAQMVSEP